jgi:hypothetical protein
VAIGFSKPAHYYGSTITTRDELLAASGSFKAHYLARAGLTGDEGGSPRRGSVPGSPPRGSSGGGAETGASSNTSGSFLGSRFGRRRAAPQSGGMRLVASVGELSTLDGQPGGSEAAAAAARRSSGGGADGSAPGRGAAGPLKQWRTLLWRELLAITRNPFDVAGRTLTFAWVGLLMGILYYGLPVRGQGAAALSQHGATWAHSPRKCTGGSRIPPHRVPHAAPPLTAAPPRHVLRPPPPQFTAGSARGRLNLIFMLLCFYCLMPYISMSLYTADKKFYLSDASSQLYRPGPYYLAKVGTSRRQGLDASGSLTPAGAARQREPHARGSLTRGAASRQWDCRTATHHRVLDAHLPRPLLASLARSPPSRRSRSCARSCTASPRTAWRACATARGRR